MPDLDGGHWFLTALFPVALGDVDLADGRRVTHSHALREELALLPTAMQSPETVAAGLVSPFARCTRTHFVRLFVIDQPMFNGRDPADPLVAALRGRNPLQHQPFDVLSRPWLVLAADFDRRVDEPDDGLASWCAGLWRQSEPEMRALFQHTLGFETVGDASGFAAHVARCRLPTTMSFNDYWPGRPPLKGESLARAVGGALAVAAGVVALLWLLLRPDSGWWLLLLAVPGLAAGALAAGVHLDRRGRQPFPPAPDSDLPTILKALYLQQRFAFLAETVQGMAPEALHRSFAQFLETTRPEDPGAPTQQPGVIRSDGVMLVRPELPETGGQRP